MPEGRVTAYEAELWDQLVGHLASWAVVEDPSPGHLRVRFVAADGTPRAVVIEMDQGEWGDTVSVLWGSFDDAVAEVRRTIGSLQCGQGRLRHVDYRLEPVREGDGLWDPLLFAGSARHYVLGRVPYPATMVETIVKGLGLDGTGRLLDLGCGPGSLTLPLAPHVVEAVGVDPDAGMLDEARSAAARTGQGNLRWLRSTAEELAERTEWGGAFDVVTLAQSFHWMDRPRVARLIHDLLTDDGALVFVHATTHAGVDAGAGGPHPAPPWSKIEELVRAYLGPRRRAGASYRNDARSERERGEVETAVLTAAGLRGPVRSEVPGGVVTRTAEQVVHSVLSLSYAAPHLFGDRLAAFEGELRQLLAVRSSEALFNETMRGITVDLWRR